MKPLAWRVGLFALLGLALLLGAIIGSTRWFAATESASMRFDGSVFGLQVGAPVVFRGVRIGQVTAFGLAPLGPGGVSVPVTAQFDRVLLRELLGPGAGSGDALVPALVAHGMIARLAMQSLLTGQLYVELDLDSSRASAARPAAAGSGLPSIPTEPTRLQTLQAQLQGLDLAQIGQDLAALAQSARRLMAGPQPERALTHTADAAQAVQRLASRLERELVPLAGTSRETLADARQALQQLGQGAQQVGRAASAAQAQAQQIAEATAPLLAELRQAAQELALAAAALRQATAEDSTLRLGADRALQDVSRAARSLRELSETLEGRPELLLRGRAAAP